MKSFAHEGKEPWHEALISGFILDPDRKKMSKSKGNVVTPMDLLVKHSADAVRYWASRAKLGIDTAFEEQIMEQGRKLTMKMFNASKFAFMMVEKSGVSLSESYVSNITADLDKAWAMKLKEVVASANRAFENNDYAFALELTEKCFWDFCDNYLELIKGRAYSENPVSAVSSLMLTIDVLMRLFAPALAFTSEEIWQSRPWSTSAESIHKMPFPSIEEFASIQGNANVYDQAVLLINLIRKEKAEQKRSIKTPVLELVVSVPETAIELQAFSKEDIINAANIKENNISFVAGDILSLTTCVFGEDEKKIKA